MESPSAASPSSSATSPEIDLSITHHGKPALFHFPEDATITTLSDTVEEILSIPSSRQKYMITPKVGLLKPPFKDPELPLRSLLEKKIVLMGSTEAEVANVDEIVFRSSKERTGRTVGRLGGSTPGAVKPAKRRDWKKDQEEALYTFTTLRPLPYLPNPDRSLRFLERLRDDAGIKASMRKHHWTVPLLTEMNPAEHTTHESRTLGLNRNGGEVIELRLRTDAYDGYRDYKTIRKTLCHELAHNVWGEHDRNFWDLCKAIEKEVETNDWRSGGKSLSSEEFYDPEDEVEEAHMDHGGWTGGEFVLGGGNTLRSAPAASASSGGITRRDVLARAAEERIKKQNEIRRAADADGT
jgi:hypothetical protein